MKLNRPTVKISFWALCFLLLTSYEIVRAQADQQPVTRVHFSKHQIAAESYESVAVTDVDRNGELDIISGAYWYAGPDFVDRSYIGAIERYGEYWDEFLTIPLDINGDGNMDFVTGGWFSESLSWRENPGDDSQWEQHLIAETGNVETARGWDVDGDGYIEIVPNNPNDALKFYKLDRDNEDTAVGTFTEVVVADSQDHGLGFGDVNGDGRGDFIVSHGWLEAPEEVLEGDWTLHEEFDFGSASIPILVVDVNGDSQNDLIVGQAHSYGLHWYEQTVNESGQREWLRHPIDTNNSQFHTMEWVDLDGDGNSELLTGKRYRAHNGDDPGGEDPIGLYYYKWNGESFVKNTISYGPLGEGKGTGIYFTTADLRGTGRQDIIVAGKDGLYLFYNQGNQ